MKKICTIFVFAILLFSIHTNLKAQSTNETLRQPAISGQSPKTNLAVGTPEFIEVNNLALKKALNDEFEDARKLFVKSLELNPECTVCRYNLSWVLLHMRQYDGAIEIAEALIKNDPGDYKTAAVLGIAYLKKERYAESVSYLKQAIAVKPNADLLAKLGYVYAKMGDFKNSIIFYDKSMKLDPKDAEMLNNRGYVLYSLGRHREALECLSNAALLAPGHAEIYNNLGAVYEKSGKEKKAAESYQKAIELNSDYADARFNLALLYLKSNDRQGAYKQLSQLERFNISLADKLRKAIQGRFVINALKP